MARREDDQAFEKRLRALGYGILRIERAGSGAEDAGIELTEIRFVLNADHGNSVLAVLKGLEVEEKVIAFVGGYDLSTVVLDVARRLENDGLRWREDVPYGGR